MMAIHETSTKLSKAPIAVYRLEATMVARIADSGRKTAARGMRV